ncbi:MAG: hypothetical protein HOO06_00135 [Bdellovibrionaceae bacterium]|jgi:hypothetical protein|nr:hypothetical protein [Pseudobdellovibrionaceae bacterium]
MSSLKVQPDGELTYSFSESAPTTPKKFRKGTDVTELYKFVHKYDLQAEAIFILNKIKAEIKAKTASTKKKKK